MSSDEAVNASLAALAALQLAWCIVYGTGPWRSTRLGWVWLLKGTVLFIDWTTLLVNQYHPVANATWIGLIALNLVATGVWVWATVRARRGQLT